MTARHGFFYRTLRALLLMALLLTAASLASIWYVGAWNIVFPSSDHETRAPLLPSDLGPQAILLFSKTNGFRHKDGIEGGNKVLQAIAGRQGWTIYATENGAVFNSEDLARFRAVVFQNVSGDVLSVEQESAFQQWLLNGGGWLGIHAAGDGSHSDWPWYEENLLGARFTAHIMGPQFQRATVVLENQEHPVLVDVPDIWEHEEEWYSWEQSPRAAGFTVLATLDEDSYTPVQKIFGRERDLSMGDHPVVWSNCPGEGRSVYMAMGHRAEAFDNSKFQQLLRNALVWLLGESSGGCQ